MKTILRTTILSLSFILMSCNPSLDNEKDLEEIKHSTSSIYTDSNEVNSNSTQVNSDNSGSENENQSDYVKIVNECGDKVDFAIDPSGVQNNSLSGGNSIEISMKHGDKVRVISGEIIYTHSAGNKGPVYLCK